MKDQIHKLHKYRRIRHLKGRRDMFMCGDPECTHRINAMYLDGKAAECYYCGEKFTINRTMLRKQGFLHCSNCKRNGKPAVPTIEEIEKSLRGLL